MIEPSIVKAGEQMRCAGTGSRDADAELAGEFGVGRGHEGGHFLVPRLDELDLAVGAVERPEHAVDPVAGIAEHAPYAPGMKPRNDKVPNCLRHDPPSKNIFDGN